MSATSTIDRYAVQRQRAIDHANEIRLRRAYERRQIRAMPPDEGKAALAELVLDCPDWLANLPVHLLLQWLPRYGPSRTAPLLALISVRQVKPLGMLTDRQRCLLAVELDHRVSER